MSDHTERSGSTGAFDPTNLQVLANHARAAAENMAHTLHRTAHSAFVKETQDFTVMLMDRLGATFAVPMELGATWYPGLSWRVSSACRGLSAGRHRLHERPLFGPCRYPCAGHASLEAYLRRWGDHCLGGRAYPQHGHGRRGAGVAQPRPDGDPSGRHPLSADEAGARGNVRRADPPHHGHQRAQARSQHRRHQGADRRARHR